MHGTFMRENREIPFAPVDHGQGGGPLREGSSRKPEMHEDGRSDSPVVPAKPSNKAVAAEGVEGRVRLTKGNTASTTGSGLRAGTRVSQGLDRVRQAAKRNKEARFTALLHHVDIDCLREAFWAINPKAAAGVDGVTWEAYGENLEANLQDLHRRLHSGAYRAKPVRRAYIPKANGRQRPLGIASLEDKIAQGALVKVLNCVYEAGLAARSSIDRVARSSSRNLGRSPIASSSARSQYFKTASAMTSRRRRPITMSCAISCRQDRRSKPSVRSRAARMKARPISLTARVWDWSRPLACSGARSRSRGS